MKFALIGQDIPMLLPTLLTGAGCLLAWLWKLAFAH